MTKAGDTITLEHPNGDRIGPRLVEAVRQPGGAMSLLVQHVGDFNPSVPAAQHGRYLESLLSAGWVIVPEEPPTEMPGFEGTMERLAALTIRPKDEQ